MLTRTLHLYGFASSCFYIDYRKQIIFKKLKVKRSSRRKSAGIELNQNDPCHYISN